MMHCLVCIVRAIYALCMIAVETMMMSITSETKYGFKRHMIYEPATQLVHSLSRPAQCPECPGSPEYSTVPRVPGVAKDAKMCPKCQVGTQYFLSGLHKRFGEKRRRFALCEAKLIHFFCFVEDIWLQQL